MLRCVVPNCNNLHPKWFVSFPADLSLITRWFQAIALGTKIDLSSESEIIPESEETGNVCNQHFPNIHVSDMQSHYYEPVLFENEGIAKLIVSCRLCFQIVSKEHTISKNEYQGSAADALEIIWSTLLDQRWTQAIDEDIMCEDCLLKIDTLQSIIEHFRNSQIDNELLLQRAHDKTIPLWIIQDDINTDRGTMSNANDGNQIKMQVTEDGETTEKVPDETSPMQELVPMEVKKQRFTRTRPTIQSRKAYEKSKRKCYICDTYLDTVDDLMHHLMIAHDVKEFYKCSQCQHEFSQAIQYNRHLSQHDNVTRPIECGYCSRRFLGVQGKMLHEARHHGTGQTNGNSITTIMETTSPAHTSVRAKATTSKAHRNVTVAECKACGKTFPSRRNLKRHLSTHLNHRPYICEKCGLSYRYQTTLKDHIKEKHFTGQQPNCVCGDCGKPFLSNRQLYYHRRTRHPDFISAATRAGNSDSLVYRSTGKASQCTLCSETLHRSGDIVDHIERCHPEAQRQLFECSICQRKFASRQAIHAHQYIHTDKYRCSHCGKRNYSGKMLSQHLVAQHSAPPLTEKHFTTCTVCDKRFPHGPPYERHKRTHSNEKRWKCTACEKTFREKHQLETHKKKHPVESINQSEELFLDQQEQNDDDEFMYEVSSMHIDGMSEMTIESIIVALPEEKECS